MITLAIKALLVHHSNENLMCITAEAAVVHQLPKWILQEFQTVTNKENKQKFWLTTFAFSLWSWGLGVFLQVRWDEEQRPWLVALKQQLHRARSHPRTWDKFTRCGWGCREQVGCREPGSCCRVVWDSRRSSKQCSSNSTGLAWVSATLQDEVQKWPQLKGHLFAAVSSQL